MAPLTLGDVFQREGFKEEQNGNPALGPDSECVPQGLDPLNAKGFRPIGVKVEVALGVQTEPRPIWREIEANVVGFHLARTADENSDQTVLLAVELFRGVVTGEGQWFGGRCFNLLGLIPRSLLRGSLL